MSTLPTMVSGFPKTKTGTSAPSPHGFFPNVVGVSGANQRLILVVSAKAGSVLPSVTGVPVTGTSGMTLVGKTASSEGTNGLDTEVWTLAGPPTTGTYDVDITFDPSFPNTGYAAILLNYQDASQNTAAITATVLSGSSYGTDVDGTAAITTVQSGMAANSVCINAWGAATTSATLTAPNPSSTTDVLLASAINSTRVWSWAYEFDATSGGSHTFDSTLTVGTYLRSRQVSFVIPPVPADSVSVTDFGGGEIFQCSPPFTGTTGSVPVAATYTGATAASAKFAIYAADGTTLVQAYATPASYVFSGGNISGVLTAPTGGGRTGGYRIAVQTYDGGGSVVATSLGSHLWGVGDTVYVNGSSSGEHLFTFTGLGQTANPILSMYFGPSTGISIGGSASVWGTPQGDGAIYIGNQMIAWRPGVPVAVFGMARGGATLSEWQDPNNAPSVDGTNGPFVKASWQYEIARGAPAAMIDVGAGSNDVRNNNYSVANGYNYATAVTALSTLWTAYYGWMTTAWGSSLPMIHSMCQRFEILTQGTGTQMQSLHTTEMTSAEAQTKGAYIVTTDLPLDSDQTHYTPAAELTMATRSVNALGYLSYGQSATWRGPKPTGLTVDGSGNLVMTFGLNGAAGLVNAVNDGSFTLATSAYTATDNVGGAATISAVTITAANQITLTMASPQVAGATAQYLPGQNPGGAATPSAPNLAFAKA